MAGQRDDLDRAWRQRISRGRRCFPSNLFVILVGVTYLFTFARNNGTVEGLVHAA